MASQREDHADGSHTDRYDDSRHTSVTTNSDGTTRETSRDESATPFGDLLSLDSDVRVTRDGNGDIVNIQNLKK